jgi:hypothetical protein
MNAQRRKTIAQLEERLQNLMNEAAQLAEEITEVMEEEQEYLDNMPESMACGEKGKKAEAAIDAMSQVIDFVTDFAGGDGARLTEAAE